MAFLVNSLGLVTALVSFPLTGAWHADVSVSPQQGETGTALTGRVSIELNGITLSGTVLRSEPSDSMVSARVAAGAGGLSNVLGEFYYKGSVTIRKIVGDILRETGETLSPLSSTALLDTVIGTWQRERGPAGIALSRVLEEYNGSWRSLPNGDVLVVATETWPTVEPAHTRVPGSDPIQGTYRIAWPELTPSDVLPGITFLDQRIAYVVHELSPEGLRTELRVVQPRTLLDRMRAAFAREEWHTRRYPSYVETVQSNGSVDVVAGNFGLTQVPIRTGVPGLRAEPLGGSNALLGFEDADPQKPYVSDWRPSGSAKFGTVLLTVSGPSAATPGLVVSLDFFEPDDAGELALAAALAAIGLSGGTLLGLTMPIQTGTVKEV